VVGKNILMLVVQSAKRADSHADESFKQLYLLRLRSAHANALDEVGHVIISKCTEH
jgi:hypothetical protein